MGVTVKKCHMIMSGNDCWNSVCFSCCRKVDNIRKLKRLFYFSKLCSLKWQRPASAEIRRN